MILLTRKCDGVQIMVNVKFALTLEENLKGGTYIDFGSGNVILVSENINIILDKIL